MDSNTENKIQVKFFTKIAKYSLPDVPLSVDSDVDYKILNSILHQLLFPGQQVKEKINFDFLINKNLLRLKLFEHLKEFNISSENQVEIEYIEKTIQPNIGQWMLHSDWLTSIKALDSDCILSSCYDGYVKIWKKFCPLSTFSPAISFQAHPKPIKSLLWLDGHMNSDTHHFLTCSDDGSSIVWQWNNNDNKINDNNNNNNNNNNININNIINNNNIKKLEICKELSREEGKNSKKSLNVSCSSLSPDFSLFATGSWNSTINIWNNNYFNHNINNNNNNNNNKNNNNITASKSKRKKIDNNETGVKLKLPIRTIETPESSTKYQGHVNQITGVCWHDNDKLISSSLDHMIKIWDIKQDKLIDTITTSKSLLFINFSLLSNLLATGSCDRHIRMYDPRIISRSVMKIFTSHTGWVSCLNWSPSNENFFISGGYDSVAKMWDLRSPNAPLYELFGHEDRILCCDWSMEKLILTGGVDKMMRIYDKDK